MNYPFSAVSPLRYKLQLSPVELLHVIEARLDRLVTVSGEIVPAIAPPGPETDVLIKGSGHSDQIRGRAAGTCAYGEVCLDHEMQGPDGKVKRAENAVKEVEESGKRQLLVVVQGE